MKTLFVFIGIGAILSLGACKEDCQVCSHNVGGVAAGGSVVEEREVCDEAEANALEESSVFQNFWECE